MSVLKCTITLDKTNGITVEVEDPAAGATQTLFLSKDAIISTVKGAGGTSTVTQKADSVAIACKKFSVDADEINCTSKMASSYVAKTTMAVSGTQQVSVDGLTAEYAGTTVSVKAKGVLSAEASGAATVKGSIVSLSAPQVMLG